MSRTRTLVIALLLAGVATLSLAPRSAAADSATLDLGRFTLSQGGRPVRVEDFAFEGYGDSLVVRAASAPWRERESDLRFDKHMLMVVDAHDFDLISYSSHFDAAADTLRRGITLARGDTAFTLWRESGGRGVGDVLAKPPGRLYVLDPPLCALFGYIGWTMRGRDCDHRPIHLMVVGAQDALVEATVTEAATQKLDWNGQSVTCRKLLIGDEEMAVEAWFTPDGHMLRLEQPRAGVRAERSAPAAEPGPTTEPEPAHRP
jgi:hypothetical protein